MKGLSGKLGILLISGTLYSTLHSLERRGLVKSELKSHKIYSLTPKDERFINTLLSDQTTRQFLTLLQRPLSEVEKHEKSRRDPTFKDFLEICKEANHLLRQIRKFPDTQGRKPSNLRAALIHHIAEKGE